MDGPAHTAPMGPARTPRGGRTEGEVALSTTPGKDSWTDAGLVPMDDAGLPAPERAPTGEPVRRSAWRDPDEADPADLADQADADDDELPTDLGDDVPEADALDQHLTTSGLPPEPPRLHDDAAEHDVLEQALDVPLDDEEYPTA